MSFGIIIRGKHDRPEPKKYTSKELAKHFGHIEDHSFKHFNRALGCKVESKEHYIKLLNERGFVPQAEGDRLVQEYKKKNSKEYKGISDKTMKAIQDLKMTTGKSGKLDPETAKRACESAGMKFNRDLSMLPAHYQDAKGGFA